jgi:hypothetical protein
MNIPTAGVKPEPKFAARRQSGFWGDRRRRLPFKCGQISVDTRPGGSTGRPDCRGRSGDLSVIQRPRPHEHQVRARFGFTEQVRSTSRAETPMHSVAAIGDAQTGSKRRGVSCGYVLAHPAPAQPGDNWVGLGSVPHRPTHMHSPVIISRSPFASHSSAFQR